VAEISNKQQAISNTSNIIAWQYVINLTQQTTHSDYQLGTRRARANKPVTRSRCLSAIGLVSNRLGGIISFAAFIQSAGFLLPYLQCMVYKEGRRAGKGKNRRETEGSAEGELKECVPVTQATYSLASIRATCMTDART
jgi:hypothetical protein